MKLRTRICTAALVLAAALTGCSGGAAKPSPLPLPEGIPEDIILETAGIAKDTPLLTVDGREVPAEEVLYWLTANADQYAMYGMSDLSMDMGDGQTLGQFYLDSAVETVKLYSVVENHADELKLGWNRENQADYEEQIATMKQNLATQEGLDPEKDGATIDDELVRLISYMGLSQEGFFHINQASYLFSNLRDGIYGEKGQEAPTAEKLEEAGVLRAKHILVKAAPVTDEAGNVTDDGMAAALEKADEIHRQLTEAEDPTALFDQLMAEHSEDPGSQSQPDGYTFGPDERVQEFYDGTKALAVGEISAPVKSSYGYHIILRLDPSGADGNSKYADLKINSRVEQWMEEAQVEKTEALENLDIQAFYDGLTTLRASIAQASQAATAPAETGAPGTAAPTETDAGTPEGSGASTPPTPTPGA